MFPTCQRCNRNPSVPGAAQSLGQSFPDLCLSCARELLQSQLGLSDLGLVQAEVKPALERIAPGDLEDSSHGGLPPFYPLRWEGRLLRPQAEVELKDQAAELPN